MELLLEIVCILSVCVLIAAYRACRRAPRTLWRIAVIASALVCVGTLFALNIL